MVGYCNAHADRGVPECESRTATSMLTYPEIDPIIVQIGPLALRWYGVTYLIGFLGAFWLGSYRAKQPHNSFSGDQVGDLVFYSAIGAILGGRLGYALFYQSGYYVQNPLGILQIWQGGMSFHGGMLGVFVACWFYARRYRKQWFEITDFAAPLVPIGLGAGRIGNFINGELWGAVTDKPWGMVFPGAGPLPRHPSMLYEAFLEGLVLFLLLWFYSGKPRPRMAVSGLFLTGYGAFRTLVEFVREPDRHLGYLAGDWLTMGMVLSLPMAVAGLLLIGLSRIRS